MSLNLNPQLIRPLKPSCRWMRHPVYLPLDGATGRLYYFWTCSTSLRVCWLIKSHLKMLMTMRPQGLRYLLTGGPLKAEFQETIFDQSEIRHEVIYLLHLSEVSNYQNLNSIATQREEKLNGKVKAFTYKRMGMIGRWEKSY